MKLKKLAIALVACCWTTLSIQAQDLRFNSNGKFKIVQFTDIHWIPGNPNSQYSEERMNEILDLEKPDLVVFTGDFVTGSPASTGMNELLQPTVSRNIPFAMTFGNHDDEQDMTREELFEYMKRFKGNLTQTTPGISGITNFILPIKSAQSDKDATILYFFDSHSYSSKEEVKGYDWIKNDQINWYITESKKNTIKNNGTPYPGLAFFHIPLPEYEEAAISDHVKLIGTHRERPCAPLINSGLFAAMIDAGDVMGTFVGHDHVNDYAAIWKGILLCYGRFTGSATTYHDIPGGNGARIIELTEGEREFKSWIRLKGGEIINRLDYPVDFINKK